MNFLSTADIPVCQTPAVLEIIYFGKLILNIGTVLLPIILIILIMLDFSKCLISNDFSNQKKATKLAFKRIFYTVIVFSVPYIVNLLSSILSDFMPDYNLCITNATPENIAMFTEEYEKARELEKQERLDAIAETISNEINDGIKDNSSKGNFDLNNFENLSQFDPRWGTYPLCTNISRGGSDGRTIGSSGCGFVSYTMVLRSYGNLDIYPDDVVEVVCSTLKVGRYGHAVPDDFFALSRHYGLKAQSLGALDYGSMEKALKDGKKLIVNIPGHYISILGIRSDNTVIVGDSSRDYETTGPYTMKSLAARSGNFYNVTAIWK